MKLRLFSLSILFLCIVLVVIGVAYFFAHTQTHETTITKVQIGAKEWQLIGVADTAEARTLGLSYRDLLEKGSGLLFTFPEAGTYAFWMKGMRFPLDIIFIRDGKVDSVARNRIPGDLTPIPPLGLITEVLEVNAGEAEEVEPGQLVILH